MKNLHFNLKYKLKECWKSFALLFLMVIASNAIFATHNRAGEITYVQKGPYTFEITLITYTYTKAPADRPELDIYFGDGTFSTVPRILRGIFA